MPRNFDTAVVTIGIDPGTREKVVATKNCFAREYAAMPDR